MWHAKQFYEFFKGIARGATVGDEVRLAPALIQPMAADNVASAVGRVTVSAPIDSIVEVAGPVQFRLDEFVAQGLKAHGDGRTVVTDPQARYFGALLAGTTFEDWLSVDVMSGPKP